MKRSISLGLAALLGPVSFAGAAMSQTPSAEGATSAPKPPPTAEGPPAATPPVASTPAETPAPAPAEPEAVTTTTPEASEAPAEQPPPVADPHAASAEAGAASPSATAGVEENGGYDSVAPPTATGLVEEGTGQNDGRKTLIAYSTAMSVGSTNDFIDQFSFAGFSFEWRARVRESFWAGVSLGWQVLYNKAERTSEIGNVALTGTQVRHLNTFPLLLTGHYYRPSKEGKVQPYGGLGAGVFPSEWRVDVGLLTASSVTWHFGFAPELGILIPVGHNRFSLSSRFNYAFESGGNPEIMFFSFAFGVELD